ncbi:hypothetical protein [Paracoccus sp. (in: a-proteobacteria)]|uniref:sulfotransferase family protein n=1 Tax=Paracoccus sp. TaxID=267 RepID=UPI0028ADA2F0|nr:hypothetical protein [Paracoccus sp. (in: a-proteobacteria)]
MTESNRSKRVQPERRAIIVLGMHRSGTSALSGLLMKLGGDGPLTPLGPHRDNSTGYFESKPLYLLQDELLTSAGTSWDDYRPFPRSWLASPKADEFHHKMESLLATEYGSSGFFVIKDPRICRLLPFWLDVLDGLQAQPLFVHTHRNPLEVAQSLHKRDGLDLEYGYLLWLRHILDAEAGSRGKIRSFTSYDRLLQGWPAEVEKIATDLRISWPKYDTAHLSSLDQMIRPQLRRSNACHLTESQVFAQWFQDVLKIFNRWAEHGEDVMDHAMLDQIRRGFNESAGIFGGVVHAKGRAQAFELDGMRQKAEGAFAQSVQLQAELDAVTVERDGIVAQLDLGRSMLDQRKAEIDDTTRELQEARAALTEAEGKQMHLARCLDRAEEKIRTLENNEARQNQDLAKLQIEMLKNQDQIVVIENGRRAESMKSTETIRQLKDRLAKSDAKVQALLTSNSWRVTAPIRWIVLRFKR